MTRVKPTNPIVNVDTNTDQIEAKLDTLNGKVSTAVKQDDIIEAVSGSYNYIQSDEGATYKYYGYASSTGWQFKRKTLATGVWMIARGIGDYDTAWADRVGKSYAYV